MALLEGGGIYEGYREDSEEVGCFYCHKTRDGRAHAGHHVDGRAEQGG